MEQVPSALLGCFILIICCSSSAAFHNNLIPSQLHRLRNRYSCNKLIPSNIIRYYSSMREQVVSLKETKSFDGSRSSNCDRPMITFTFQCIIPLQNLSIQEIYDECIDFNWRRGGGLWFVPPPIIIERGDGVTGEGMERMILPVLLRERIILGSRPTHAHDHAQGNIARIIYKVMNPSIWTFYPVKYHQGEILFEELQEGTCQLKWIVRVCPMFACRAFVRASTTFIITKYITNLRETLLKN